MPQDEDEGRVAPSLPGPNTETQQPARYFFSASELEIQPTPISEILPDYPETALASDLSGWADLELWIDRDGTVLAAQPLASEPDQAFGTAAQKAFQQARFSAGQIRGEKVPAHIKIRVVFELPD